MAGSIDLTDLKKHKEEGNRAAFGEALSGFLPQLKELVRHKLRQWEARGEIPKNEYSAEEIVDEVYIKVFDEFHDVLNDPGKLKVKMYGTARDILNALKEKHGGESISVEELLAREAKELEEKYTADAEGELILMGELDDISYHHDDRQKENVLLLDEAQIDELAETLELKESDTLSKENKLRIGKAYTDLPELSKSVIDHHVFVKLSNEQIAEIHKISVESVEHIIGKAKTRMSAAHQSSADE